MAEDYKDIESTGQDNSLSYDSILNNNDILNSMYYALKDMGTDVEIDPKTILDTFLTKSRYIDTNILSTISTANKVSDYTDEQKQSLAKAMDAVNRMPNIFSEGGAPTGSAIADYALAGISDPTNLLSAVVGAFTLGTGAVATRAAGTTARAIAVDKIKSIATKPVLGALARDAAVAGTAGATQNITKQNIEKDIGLREDIDLGEAAIQGLAEGILSPAAGVAANIGAGLVGRGTVNIAEKIAPENTAAARNWLRNNFSPAAGLDDATIALTERRAGEVNSLGERAQDIQTTFQKNLDKTFGKNISEPDLQLINKALENDAPSIAALGQRNAELAQNVTDFRNLVNEASQYGLQSKLNTQARGVFTNNANYTRDVYDRYLLRKRKTSFEKFLNQQPTILNDLKQMVINDRANPVVADRRFTHISDQFYDANNNIIPGANVDGIIRKEFEKLYNTTGWSRREENVFQRRGQFDPAFKKLLGANETPAARITETIGGIMDTASKSNLIYDLAKDAERAGKGVTLAPNATAGEASVQLGNKEVVKLVNPGDKYAVFNQPFLKKVDPALENVWVTKEYADQLKTFLDPAKEMREVLFNAKGPLGALFKTFAGIQAYAKYGKTILSPSAQGRNFISAGGYTTAAGDFGGIAKGLKTYLSKNSLEKELLLDEFAKSGLGGSSLELGQALSRLKDISAITDENSFISKLMRIQVGRMNVGKKFEKAYALGDDLFKHGMYLNNKEKALKVLDAYPTTGTLNRTSIVNDFAIRRPDLVDSVRTDFFGPKMTVAKRNQILSDFQRKYPGATANDYFAQEAYLRDAARQKVAAIAPMYNRIAPIFEKMRVVPVIGSFVAYPAERLRNTYNILKIGTDELKQGIATGNKELIAQGRNRLLQWYGTQGALYTGVYAVNEMNGNSETVDKLRKSGLLPEYKKDNAILITGKTKEGFPKYLDLSYMNPDQYVVGSFVPLMLKASRGEDVSKDLDKAIMGATKNIFQPYTDPSLSLEFFDLVRNFYDDPTPEKIGKAAKILEPGILRSVRDAVSDTGVTDNTRYLYDIDKFFNPRNFGAVPRRSEDAAEYVLKNASSLIGFREEYIDPRKAAGFALKNITGPAEQKWNSFKKDLSSMISDPTAAYSMENYLKDYNEALKEQFILQQGIKRLDDGLRQFMSREQVNKLMKSFDLRGVAPSKKDVLSILYGKHTPQRLSTSKEFWLDVQESLRQKTGKYPGAELTALKNNMQKLENMYQGRNLLGEPPDITIGE